MVFHQLWISPLLLTLSVDPDWESKSFVSLLILRHSPEHHRTAIFNGFQWMPSDDFNGDFQFRTGHLKVDLAKVIWGLEVIIHPCLIYPDTRHQWAWATIFIQCIAMFKPSAWIVPFWDVWDWSASKELPFAKSSVMSNIGIAIMRASAFDLHSNISPPFGASSANLTCGGKRLQLKCMRLADLSIGGGCMGWRRCLGWRTPFLGLQSFILLIRWIKFFIILCLTQQQQQMSTYSPKTLYWASGKFDLFDIQWFDWLAALKLWQWAN